MHLVLLGPILSTLCQGRQRQEDYEATCERHEIIKGKLEVKKGSI